MHHDHSQTGIFGMIYALLGYFAGMASGIIPEVDHWYSALIPAASAAFVGWAVTKILNWIWPITKTWCGKILSKFSILKLWKK